MSSTELILANIDKIFDIFKDFIKEEAKAVVAEEMAKYNVRNKSNRLTTKEAAAYLHIKPQTLRKWSSQEKIENHKVGRNCVYDKEVLDEYYDKKKRPTLEKRKANAATKEAIDRLEKRLRRT